MNEFKTIVYLDGKGSGKHFYEQDQRVGSKGVELFIEERVNPCIEAALKSLGKNRKEVQNSTSQGDDFEAVFDSAQEAHHFAVEFHKKAQEINDTKDLENAKFWFRIAAVTAKLSKETNGLYYGEDRGISILKGDPFVKLKHLQQKAQPGGLLIDEETFEKLLHPELKLQYEVHPIEIPDKHNYRKNFAARNWKSPYSPTESNESPLRSSTASGYDSESYLLKYAPDRDEKVFTGRENILEEIDKNFKSNRIQAIHALGGVGKTTTALEYAYRSVESKRYQSVFWARADSEETLLSEFKRIAEAIGLEKLGLSSVELNVEEDEQSDKSVYKQAVFGWLKNEANSSWLLVYDNADDSNEPGGERAERWLRQKSLLPLGKHGRILITSRSNKWKNLQECCSLELFCFEPEESRAFLEKRLYKTIKNTSEEAVTMQLADELGHLPLALEQAVAYMLENDTDIDSYYQLFKALRLSLLDEMPSEKGDYFRNKLVVGTTWTLNFNQLSKSNPAASKLLEIAAFLNPDDIPFDIFFHGAHIIGREIAEAFEGKEEILAKKGMREMLSALTSYSLVRWRGGRSESFDVHRLVQEVIRTYWIKDHQQQEILDRITTCLCEMIPFELGIWGISLEWSKSDGTWETYEMIFPHAQTALKYAEKLDFISEQIFILYNFLADYLKETQKYEDAIAEGYLKAIRVGKQEKLLPHFQQEKAFVIIRLADTYRRIKRFQESLDLLSEIEEYAKQNQQIDYDLIQTFVLKEKGKVYGDQKKYSDSEYYHLKALEMTEREPNLAYLKHSILNSLGNCYRFSGKFNLAIEKYKEVEELPQFFNDERGETHLGYLRGRYNLAKAYTGGKRFEEAQEIHDFVLRERISAFGAEHPETAKSLSAIGNLYRDWGKDLEGSQRKEYLEKSLKNLEKAYEINRKYVELSDPRIGPSLYNLVTIFKLNGKHNDLRNLLQEAQIECEESLNDEDANPTHLGFIYRNLAIYYENIQRNLKLAKCYFQKAVDRDKYFDTFERKYESLKLQGLFYKNRADKCRERNKKEGARKYYDAAISSLEEAISHEDILIKVKAEIHCKLGDIYKDLAAITEDNSSKEDYRKKAESSYVSAIKLNNEFWGESNIHAARISKDLGAMYLRYSRNGKDKDRLDKAISFLNQSLQIYNKDEQKHAKTIRFVERQLKIAEGHRKGRNRGNKNKR